MSELNLTPREIFIAVPVSISPVPSTFHIVLPSLQEAEFDKASQWIDARNDQPIRPAHYLEKRTAIVLSEEELDEIITDAWNDGYDKSKDYLSEQVNVYKEELKQKQAQQHI